MLGLRTGWCDPATSWGFGRDVGIGLLCAYANHGRFEGNWRQTITLELKPEMEMIGALHMQRKGSRMPGNHHVISRFLHI
jgi:hypothetical protein